MDTAPPPPSHDRAAVTVIGLGAMGAALAHVFLERGRRLTVWNRSPGKAEALTAAGARLAGTAAEAAAASPLVVMCLYDRAAVDAVLATPGMAAAMRTRTLVQLTTGGPADARAGADWAARAGARYLDGAIQAAPSQMGRPDAPVLVAGDEATWQDARAVLEDLAGRWVHLGPGIEAAATMDLATLSHVYGAFIGFVHGALIAESHGLDVARYGDIVNDIAPGFGAFFAHEGRAIRDGDYAVTESPLRISVQATQRILDVSRAAGLSTEFPELAAGLLRRAQAAGLADEEVAALIKVLRR